ncbi:MAG TPA: protein-export chaperone SecB [Gammaproteobacteria bacterium]|jgi:preprotein translocase subunit SecB|nr:protein-export chaperone SecB [Gammaproteobacteria bacterium]
MADEQTNNANQQQLMLQKIYVKDLSFESPKAPMVFTTNVQPQTEINIRSGSSEVAANTHEVTLTLTIEAKDNGATLFLAEVVQAGIFMLQGYTNDERALLLGSFCPSTLYPFAREAVADLVQRGGFPQLLLQPINFDALYQQAMQERAARESGAAAAAPAGSAGTH